MFRKFFLALIVLPGMIFLARVGMADFLRLAPSSYIESIQHGGRIYPSELLAAREQLQLAREWDPDNPIVPEFLAQIALIRCRLVSFSPGLQVMFLNEAIAELQRAIELRPNLPHLWAARMTAGSWLIAANARGLIDEALVRRELSAISVAMNRAHVLGPSEPAVLQQIVFVGREHYPDLSPEDRVIVDRAVDLAKKLSLKI